MLLAATAGHTANLLADGVPALVLAGAGLTLWIGLLAASTITRCLRTADWLPEGTEPTRLLVEGLTTEQIRLDQLANVTEKIQANKARVVALARSLTAHRRGTVAAPLAYLACLGVGWLVFS